MDMNYMMIGQALNKMAADARADRETALRRQIMAASRENNRPAVDELVNELHGMQAAGKRTATAGRIGAVLDLGGRVFASKYPTASNVARQAGTALKSVASAADKSGNGMVQEAADMALRKGSDSLAETAKAAVPAKAPFIPKQLFRQGINAANTSFKEAPTAKLGEAAQNAYRGYQGARAAASMMNPDMIRAFVQAQQDAKQAAGRIVGASNPFGSK